MSNSEKFIEEYTKNCNNLVVRIEDLNGNVWEENTPWLTPDQARRAVDIAREEMIEKACEYLDGLIELLNDNGYGLKKERIIGGLKQAMKDE